MDFLDRLKNFTVYNNITQKQLCELSGLSKSYISLVFKGERKPNNKLLGVLSALNGKSIDWWLTGNEGNDYLTPLRTLIDFFIKEGYINQDGSMDIEYKKFIDTMLNKVILERLKEGED